MWLKSWTIGGHFKMLSISSCHVACGSASTILRPKIWSNGAMWRNHKRILSSLATNATSMTSTILMQLLPIQRKAGPASVAELESFAPSIHWWNQYILSVSVFSPACQCQMKHPQHNDCNVDCSLQEEDIDDSVSDSGAWTWWIIASSRNTWRIWEIWRIKWNPVKYEQLIVYHDMLWLETTFW